MGSPGEDLLPTPLVLCATASWHLITGSLGRNFGRRVECTINSGTKIDTKRYDEVYSKSEINYRSG